MSDTTQIPATGDGERDHVRQQIRRQMATQATMQVTAMVRSQLRRGEATEGAIGTSLDLLIDAAYHDGGDVEDKRAAVVAYVSTAVQEARNKDLDALRDLLHGMHQPPVGLSGGSHERVNGWNVALDEVCRQVERYFVTTEMAKEER